MHKYQKKIIFCLFWLITFGFCQISAHAQEVSKAQMTFTELSYDFGEVRTGKSVEKRFKYKNTGNAPLVISDIRTTCGCTVPDWKKEPLLPNQETEIVVRFDTTNKVGRQHKVITVFSNASTPEIRLGLIGNVLPKDE